MRTSIGTPEFEDDQTRYYQASAQGELVARHRRDIEPATWDVARQEHDAAYRVDKRLRDVAAITQHGIDAVAETHEYINQRAAGQHPALQAELRRIEEAVAECVPLLIARYLGRNDRW